MCVFVSYSSYNIGHIRFVLRAPGFVRPPASKQVSAPALTPSQKNQLKEAGGTFK